MIEENGKKSIVHIICLGCTRILNIVVYGIPAANHWNDTQDLNPGNWTPVSVLSLAVHADDMQNCTLRL